MASHASKGPDSSDEPGSGNSPFESEFTDEGPGAYLAEWGTRRASIVWGFVNLLGTLGLGLWLHWRPLDERSEWLLLANLVWTLLPVSSLVLVVFTLWQLGTAYTPKSPGRMLWALGLGVGAMGSWGVLTWGFGVLAGGA